MQALPNPPVEPIMHIDQQARHELYQRLEAAIGTEATATLMEYLPPVGWADVATKRDLDHLEVATKRDIEQLRTDTKRDIEQLRTEMRNESGRLRQDLQQLELRLQSEIARSAADVRTDLTAQMAAQTRLIMFGLPAALAGLAGLAAVLSRLA
jgi:hypothetical protein